MSAARPIRPLGPLEVFSSSRHSLGLYRCVANTCRYIGLMATFQTQEVRGLFETAVANVVVGLPSLQAGIAGENTSEPQFVSVASLNLSNHIEWKDTAGDALQNHDSSLLRILEEQHDQLWPEISVRPPWKVTAVVGHDSTQDGLVLDIIFAAHHSLCDGRSTAAFHARLLDELNNPSGRPPHLSGHMLTVSEPVLLPQPLEELVKFSISWGFMLRTLWRELAPGWLQPPRPPAPWTGRAIALEPYRTKLRLVTASTETLSRLLASCRANGTTLTPLLHVLVLASLSRRVHPDTAKSFASSTPIDMRPFIDPSLRPSGFGGSVGVFVTSQSHSFGPSVVEGLRASVEEDLIWRLATDLRMSMKKRLDVIPKDDIIGMLRWVGDWHKYWLAKLGGPRGDTWSVSNIGSMPGTLEEGDHPPGKWRIQRSIFTQSVMAAGSAIGINVSGVTGASFCISLSWQEGIVETELLDGLADDLHVWLGHFGRDGRFDIGSVAERGDLRG